MSVKLLVINPNSSRSITAALRETISPHTPPDTSITYFNPSTGPPGIKDEETARESTEACWHDLFDNVSTTSLPIPVHDFHGILVCCFSEHPLILRLSQRLVKTKVTGMFHAAVSQALLSSGSFGILASGHGGKPNLVRAIANFLGSETSTRSVGPCTTGLEVVELQEGDQVKVEAGMKETTGTLVRRGARCIILGCAGMSGMERWVEDAARSVGEEVQVIDGAIAGVQILTGLVRASR